MQLDREKAIEFGAGIVGLVAMAGLVYSNTISVDVAVPIALAILGGIMSYESGRRKGHRNSEQPPVAELVTTVLEQIDNLPNSDAEKTKAIERSRLSFGDSDAQSDGASSDHPKTDSDAQSDGAPEQTHTDEQTMTVDERAMQKVENADYRTLQKVAGQLANVNGSATRTTITQQLSNTPPEKVLDAFAAVEGGDGS